MLSSRFSSVAVVALVVALSVATSAHAQQQRRGGGGGGRGGMGMIPGMDTLSLLNMEAVQKELKLSTDQTTKVRDTATEAMSEMQEIFSGLQDLSPEERREKMQEFRGEAETKVKELRGKVDLLLDASQKERLKQLTIQRRGDFGAIQDSEVAASLKLSDEQKKKVETLVADPDLAADKGVLVAAAALVAVIVKPCTAHASHAKGTQRKGPVDPHGRPKG